MLPAFTIFPLGDSALTIDFGNRIDDEINKKVLWLFQKLQRHSLPIKDIIPAYSSLSIFYDAASLHTNDKTAFERVKELLLPLLVEEEEVAPNSRKLKVPVCYAAKFGLDLESLARGDHLLEVGAAVVLKTHRERAPGHGLLHGVGMQRKLVPKRRSHEVGAVRIEALLDQKVDLAQIDHADVDRHLLGLACALPWL